jgi:GT2 family glycosyltransferase
MNPWFIGMLTISLLNYRNWHDTTQCVQDLVAACSQVEYRILIRDNSESSELPMLRGALSRVGAPISYFESPENLGFARGHNSNFRAVDHGPLDNFLIINNDVRIPHPGIMRSLLEATGPNCLLSCTIRTSELGDVWFAGGRISKLTGDVLVHRNPFTGPQRSTQFLSGCCLLVRCNFFEQIGGFDERFFMYAEDLDFCLRARAVGTEFVVINQSIVHEVGSGEKGTYSDVYLYWNTRNRLIVLREHHLGTAPVSSVYYFLKYGAARTIQLALYSQAPMRQIAIVWRGLWDGFFHRQRPCTVRDKAAYRWRVGSERFDQEAILKTEGNQK